MLILNNGEIQTFAVLNKNHTLLVFGLREIRIIRCIIEERLTVNKIFDDNGV